MKKRDITKFIEAQGVMVDIVSTQTLASYNRLSQYIEYNPERIVGLEPERVELFKSRCLYDNKTEIFIVKLLLHEYAHHKQKTNWSEDKIYNEDVRANLDNRLGNWQGYAKCYRERTADRYARRYAKYFTYKSDTEVCHA